MPTYPLKFVHAYTLSPPQITYQVQLYAPQNNQILLISLCSLYSPICFELLSEVYVTACGHSFWYVYYTTHCIDVVMPF